MYYHGYKIVKAPHPTPVIRKRETYDIKRDGDLLKANFATIDGAKCYIDLMIRLHRWPDLQKEK